MITGDHALAAAAIARELGLQGTVLTGAELDCIDVTGLSRHIEDTAIVGAVKEGRTNYDNIARFVRFQWSTGVAAILTVLSAQLPGLPMPFTALHILWIALIVDGPPAVMLGLEPSRPGIMNEPPRRSDARILTQPRFGRLMAYGSTMAVGTIGVCFHGLQTGDQACASTLAFNAFVLFQFFHVMNARFDAGTAFNRHPFDNRKLWLALAGVLVLQVVVVDSSPAQLVFDTVPFNLGDWLLATGVAASGLLLDEARKFAVVCWRRMKNKSSLLSVGTERREPHTMTIAKENPGPSSHCPSP